jgi:hypothetical protein
MQAPMLERTPEPPQTNLDLLNACTDAGFIDKKPVLPLLQSDGGLPPLP